MYNSLSSASIEGGKLFILKKNKTNTLINKLPDEIHILIMKYVSEYLYEIPRWNPKIKKWRSHCNIKCYKCNRKNVALSHICKSYISYNQDCGSVCCNTLICWDCAH